MTTLKLGIAQDGIAVVTLANPPMNAMDGTALPMFDCFTDKPDTTAYTAIPNRIPLNEMNHALAELKGRARKYARLSMENKADEIDEGDDDVFNRILWWATKGSKRYPSVPKTSPAPITFPTSGGSE